MNDDDVSRPCSASPNGVHRDRRRLDLGSFDVTECRLGKNDPFSRYADCRSESTMGRSLRVATSGD
ncbi:MAG: hypothetical protein VYC25_00250 [Actinomycetota bacterium]|nr:hypothetical protein [Actinomycetota bacterium]